MAIDLNQTPRAARGLTDGRDRLLTADMPLAELHERCGGVVPGTVAIPELLALVRHSRKLGLRIAREFSAFDGEEVVSGFARVRPLSDEDGGGCEVVIENWQRDPQPKDDANKLAGRLDDIDRASAEISARLDSRQHMQTLTADSADSAELSEHFRADPGKKWSSYVDLVGVSHQQPMHWRLLDGAKCRFAGSTRTWRVRLLPLGPNGDAPSGFELFLVAQEPLAADGMEVEGTRDGLASDPGIIGSSLTPVLRQPIARIIANAETIRSKLAGPLRNEYSEYAGNIASAGKHLSAMLEDLRDLEAVESPDFSIARERVDLGDAARRAAGILGVRAQDRRIKIALPADVRNCVVVGEFRRVLQILINLIGNAIAYSPEGSSVEVLLEPRLDHTIDLKVVDEGPGVDPHQASAVFDKFERLGRDNDGGSGLGLYISRKLARAMGGELSLNTGREVGAEFLLTLPKAG